ncbi:NAD(P)H-quinone oxidoreductase [Rhodoblastus sp.]|uniref:NAD(P)H-quinone oxidoreductase n=1 Tax=Rhodoblastus sp. TaxID=1962975 RepID=UPI00262F19A9|nr:NAD(P)H-quinone oxidoreductase [Rhodoblastus sp.]
MSTLPKTMREIFFDGAGGPEVIKLREAPVPTPGPGKALVEVAAAGINRPDCIQRMGLYPPPPGESDVPGLEIAGKIVALGENVEGLAVGDEICALVGSGGYAEYCLADTPLCLPRPKPLSLVEAAGIPETLFTVYDNVFSRGALKPGETFLVHGGSSGIGSTAIQLAKSFGAKVFTTAGSAKKVEFCKNLGADVAINYREQDFLAEVKTLTGKKGVDVILDMVGGPYLQKNLAALAPDGRLVQIAFLQGARVKDFDFMSVMLKRLTITGSTLRARPLAVKAAIARALREKVWPLLDSGAVKPVLHASFPLEQARAAHEMMESSGHMGKIVLLAGKKT